MGVDEAADRHDRDLLAAHVAGDPDAFGELFARHQNRLWAVALRTMGNPTDAADGLQDAAIAAFRRASSYRGEAAVTTWLHRVTVNACLDRLRAAKVRAADPLPDDLESYAARGALVVEPDTSTADPSEATLADERRRLLREALAQLPDEQRLPIVLIDVEGYSVAETASLLGAPEGTVKSRCARGRRKLAALLGPMLNGNESAPEHVPSPPGPGPAQPRAAGPGRIASNDSTVSDSATDSVGGDAR